MIYSLVSQDDYSLLHSFLSLSVTKASIIFPCTDVELTARSFFIRIFFLSSFLSIGVKFAYFQSPGTVLSVSDSINILKQKEKRKGECFLKTFFSSFNTRECRSSGHGSLIRIELL